MDKYEVLKKIGVGTYGNAYVVRRREQGDKLVLKRINVKDASREEKQAAQFEAKILKEFQHPFVLSCLDSFHHGPFMCIVTDYCEAGDLYERLRKQSEKRKSLDEKQILTWLVQLCLALKYVHERKILHRDLKTQNIFLTAKGDVILGDFGIARVLKSKVDMAKTVIGTPYYMSPEIIESKPYDYKSDLWSLGCVLFEMLSLKHAFDANDMNGLVMKILRGKVPPLPRRYSEELRQLTLNLLSKHPNSRPSLDSILKMKFLQDTLKSVRRSFEPKQMPQQVALKQQLNHRNIDRPIPDMRKQLKLQMQKKNVMEIPKENYEMPKIRESISHIKEDQGRRREAEARNIRQGNIGRKRIVAPKPPEAQDQALDMAVNMAERRLAKIHEEFHVVREQAKLLEEAAHNEKEVVAAPKQRRRWSHDDENEAREVILHSPEMIAPNSIEQKKAAQMRRKEEANRQYEEELEKARKSYHVEKKAALQKKKDLYRESTIKFDEEIPSRLPQDEFEIPENSSFIVEEEMIYGAQAPAKVDFEENSFEVEAALVYNSDSNHLENVNNIDGIDTGVLAMGGLIDKVNAIRDYCLERIGSSLFHELCGLIKLHNSRCLTSTEDVQYAGEILERLGEKRIHFAGLIDHLLYLEETLYT